jgi:hypothetical protein
MRDAPAVAADADTSANGLRGPAPAVAADTLSAISAPPAAAMLAHGLTGPAPAVAADAFLGAMV